MFRLAIGGLYELSVEYYMDTYGNESQNSYVSGLDIVLMGFGVFMCLYAIVVYIVEVRQKLLSMIKGEMRVAFFIKGKSEFFS